MRLGKAARKEPDDLPTTVEPGRSGPAEPGLPPPPRPAGEAEEVGETGADEGARRADGDSAWPAESAWADTGGGRRVRLRIAGLIALVAVITVAGVLVGNAVEPGSPGHSTATTSAGRPAAPRPHPARRWGPLRVTPFGKVPSGSVVAAAALDGRRLVVVAGRAGQVAAVYAGVPGSALRLVGKLPTPLDNAAAFAAGKDVVVVGGEQGSKPTDRILRVNAATGKVSPAGTFIEPLAESGSLDESASIGRSGAGYLIGGWTGERYATAVLRLVPPAGSSVTARLPDGLRSPAVARAGTKIYVAGGRTSDGLSRKVVVVDPSSGAVRSIGTLPAGVEHGVLVPGATRTASKGAAASSGSVPAVVLYLLGGTTTGGHPNTAILAIDPTTGRITLAGRLPSALTRDGNALTHPVAVRSGTRTIVTGAPSGVVYLLG